MKVTTQSPAILTALITLGILFTLTGCTAGLLAEEPAKENNPPSTAKIQADEKKALTAREEALKEIADAPAGVFAPEYDKEGVLLRLKIKGEAAVTQKLGAVRAERLARQSAERNAKAAFVKFLKEEVSVQENEREEVILVEKNGEEQAGYKNVSTQTIETKANGLLRGLIVLDERYTGEGTRRTVTVVYGWSKKLADAARTAQSEMARETNPAAGSAAGSKDENGGSTGEKVRTAKDLTDF